MGLEKPVIATGRKIAVLDKHSSSIVRQLHLIDIDSRAFGFVVQRQFHGSPGEPVAGSQRAAVDGNRLGVPVPVAGHREDLPCALARIEQLFFVRKEIGSGTFKPNVRTVRFVGLPFVFASGEGRRTDAAKLG